MRNKGTQTDETDDLAPHSSGLLLADEDSVCSCCEDRTATLPKGAVQAVLHDVEPVSPPCRFAGEPASNRSRLTACQGMAPSEIALRCPPRRSVNHPRSAKLCGGGSKQSCTASSPWACSRCMMKGGVQTPAQLILTTPRVDAITGVPGWPTSLSARRRARSCDPLGPRGSQAQAPRATCRAAPPATAQFLFPRTENSWSTIRTAAAGYARDRRGITRRQSSPMWRAIVAHPQMYAVEDGTVPPWEWLPTRQPKP